MKRLILLLSCMLPLFLNAQVISEDFESYDEGFFEEQANENWEGWFGSMTQSQVSTEQAYSGDKSLKIFDGTVDGSSATESDVVCVFDNLTSGIYELSMMQYIPSEDPDGNPVGAYLNLQHNYTSSAGSWATEIVFGSSLDNNTGFVNAGGTTETFDVINDEWIEVHFLIDIDADEATFSYGGDAIQTWTWSTFADPNNTATLSDFNGINFYASCSPDQATACTSWAYYDDVVVEEVESLALGTFDLVGPADGAELVLQGGTPEEATISWDASENAETYTWTLATDSGDEVVSIADLTDTELTLDYATIIDVLDGAGVEEGESIDLLWNVFSYNVTDELSADNGPFEITMTRLAGGVIIESTALNAIQLYPNPSKGMLNIDLGSITYDLLDIQVFNSAGQLVLTAQNEVNLDLSEQAEGIYQVLLNVDGELKSERVVLMK